MDLIKKRLFFLTFVGLFLTGGHTLSAQNLQLFGDFGRWLYPKECPERPIFSTTAELFHPDPWGNTFFFVDMEYTKKGVVSAYWQLVRELQFWKAPISIQLQYDGGLTNQFSYYNSYNIGPRATYSNEDNTKSFAGGILYKYIQGNTINPHSFLATIAWYLSFSEGKGTFKGYADFWQDPVQGRSDYVFFSKPQLWLNLNKFKGVHEKFNLSIGTEVRICYNLFAPDVFLIIPTAALKWTFW